LWSGIGDIKFNVYMIVVIPHFRPEADPSFGGDAGSSKYPK